MKRISLIAAALVLLSGCASRGETTSSTTFPDVSSARPAGGTFLNLDDLRQYGEGMTKRQLYALLGTPHFGEGMWNVRSWNYLFNLRPAPGQSAVQCQFQIHFDKNDVATGHAWQPSSCGALLQPPAAPTPPPPEPVGRAPLRLEADALFGFDSATLSQEGRKAIDAALRDTTVGNDGVTVVGHTDRLGSDAYNRALSQRRADAVAGYLVTQGIAADRIRTEGMGSTSPVVHCEQANRQALVACLAPNRRVEIMGLLRP